MRVHLLFLKYNRPDLEAESLRSIIKYTDWPYELRVLDNRNGTRNMAKIWNDHFRTSPYDYIGIIDSDTRVTKGWLTEMMQLLRNEAKVGVVVPSTNHCNESIQVDRRNESIQLAPLLSSFLPPVDSPNGLVSGFCFLTTTAVWRQAGPFDEGFGFYGQDSEWFVRVHRSHWRVVVSRKAFVYHVGQGSALSDPEFDWEKDKAFALKRLKLKTGIG